MNARGLDHGLRSLVSEELGVFIILLLLFFLIIFIIAQPIVIFPRDITTLADAFVSCTLILKLCSFLFHIAGVLPFAKLRSGGWKWLRYSPGCSLITWRKGTGRKLLLRRSLAGTTCWAGLLCKCSCVTLLLLVVIVLVIVLMHVVLLLVVLLILLRRECCGTSPHQLCTVCVVMSLVVHALCTCMVMVRGDLLLCLGLEGKFVLPLSAKLFEVFFLHSFAREN